MLILVTALGYFVDIYDLLLFSIVRVQSLKDIGVPDANMMTTGVHLINIQMAGLLTGGLLWGIIGDKKGRLTVLFGSILTYSVANLLNGVIHTLAQYAALRFIAGVGLAGELGAAVTLVNEALSKENRGLGTAFVASCGIAGAVVAGLVTEYTGWRHAFMIGGAMGLLLLLARVSVVESSMYEKISSDVKIVKGNFLWLFKDRARAFKYLRSIAMGVPIWFIVGVQLTFSPEIAKDLHITGPVLAGRAIMHCYAGAVVGDFLAGVVSHYLKNRRKAILIFLVLTSIGMFVFANFHDRTPEEFYKLSLYMGFASGYWAVLLTMTAEQFGTNIRSTVSSTVPNFIRATVIPLSSLFLFGGRHFGVLHTCLAISICTLTLAALSLWMSRETYGKDLNFIES